MHACRSTLEDPTASLFAPRPDPRAALRPLYSAIVAAARAPHWYRDGRVADTIDGRFEMIAALLSLTIARFETLAGRQREMALLAEVFVEDMDGQLRQQGIGDVVVGKHIGRLMSALGGRIGAYRAGFAGDPAAAVVRNLYRGDAPAPEALAHSVAALAAFRDRLADCTPETLLAGRLTADAAS